MYITASCPVLGLILNDPASYSVSIGWYLEHRRGRFFPLRARHP